MDARELALWLSDCEPEMVVRGVADWIAPAIRQGPEADIEPPLDGRAHIDALVAAAAEYVADHRGEARPTWTVSKERESPVFWHPGPDSLIAHSLVHSPAVFAIRGLLIEEDSLQCV